MKLPADLQQIVDEQNHLIRMRVRHQFNRDVLAGELIDLTLQAHQVKLRGVIEIALEPENLTHDGELPRRTWMRRMRLLENALQQLEKLACQKQKSTSLKDSSEPQKKPRRSTPRAAKTSSDALSKTDAALSPSSTPAKPETAPSSKPRGGRGRKSSAP